MGADSEEQEGPAGPRQVVGLRYGPEEGLPRVVLKGTGPLAEALLERARQRGPAVVRNDTLATALFRLPEDAAVGPALFEVVAAILAHVLGAEVLWRKENHE